MKQRLFCTLIVVLLLGSLSSQARPRTLVRPDNPPPWDPFSAAEPADARTLHLKLDLDIDFDSRRIDGVATHTIVNYTGTDRFVLDTRGLTIHTVSVNGEPGDWSLSTPTAAGQALTIPIDSTSRQVRIEYETSPSSSALNWLTPLQTLGDEAPFLFSLVQPDRAREWIPVQDTPGVRMTYEATVRVPEGLLALMSARNPTVVSPDGIYHFSMPVPIPSYLIAIAVGRLEFQPLDERTGIYAEPEVMTDALWDLQYVPDMLDVSEQIMGRYPFDRYDVLLAPPGFAAGGMENPLLNFINVVSVVSGDFDTPVPASLMAHEIAHSWGGDLVTCATWGDTWLNEGFATYFASRILELVTGPERAELGYYWDRQNYESFVQQTRRSTELQILHRDFQAGESLSIFTPTNYNKGSLFLKMLDDHLGRERFDQFVQSYFDRYRVRWVDDQSFVGHLSAFVEGDASLTIDEWLYSPGLPDNVTAPEHSALWERIGNEATRFRSGVAASRLDTSGWTSFEEGLFLWQITDSIAPRIAELDAVFGFSSRRNPSVHWWLAVATELYEPGLPRLEQYLELGSWNSISIYQRLSESPAGRNWAIDLYQTLRPHYIPPIRDRIDQILAVESAAARAAA